MTQVWNYGSVSMTTEQFQHLRPHEDNCDITTTTEQTQTRHWSIRYISQINRFQNVRFEFSACVRALISLIISLFIYCKKHLNYLWCFSVIDFPAQPNHSFMILYCEQHTQSFLIYYSPSVCLCFNC